MVLLREQEFADLFGVLTDPHPGLASPCRGDRVRSVMLLESRFADLPFAYQLDTDSGLNFSRMTLVKRFKDRDCNQQMFALNAARQHDMPGYVQVHDFNIGWCNADPHIAARMVDYVVQAAARISGAVDCREEPQAAGGQRMSREAESFYAARALEARLGQVNPGDLMNDSAPPLTPRRPRFPVQVQRDGSVYTLPYKPCRYY